MCAAAGPAKEGTCKATANGIYALKTEVDVYYYDEVAEMSGAQPLFIPWRGKVVIYLKGDLTGVCEDGTGGVGVMSPCGSAVPPILTDAVPRVVQIVFPDTLWDAPGIPKYNTTGHTTGFNPGDMLVFDKSVGLVGVSLSDPAATWPSYMQTATFDCGGGTKGMACFPDMDGDKNPGVTVTFKLDGTPVQPPFLSDWEYTPAPTMALDATNGNGATEAYIGLRTRLGGGGPIAADCKSGSGTADVDDFESRVFGCKTKAGSACNASEASFVDQNTPTFHVLKAGATPPAVWKYKGFNLDIDPKLDRTPSKGPTTSVVRLGDTGATVSCADVRNAAYPAVTQ